MKHHILATIAVATLLIGCVPHPTATVLEPIDNDSTQLGKPDQNQSALVTALKKYYLAAMENNSELMGNAKIEVDTILTNKAEDIEARDSNNQNALMIATKANDYDMVVRLADAGANVNAVTTQQIPLITLAIQEGNLQSAKALIERGANINVASLHAPSPLTITTLGGISSNDYQNMTIFLLDNGADANFGNIKNHSLLLYAIKSSQDRVATKMIQNGADIEQSDENGLTPLSWAILLNQESTIKELIDRKANADARDVYGYSPLAWAIFTDNQQAKDLMIQNGFSVKENDRGWMAAEIAKRKSLNELRALLGDPTQMEQANTEDHSIIRFKDMSFLQVTHKQNEITFLTDDEVIKDFVLAKPDRLIIDFNRGAGVKNITVPIKDSQFKKITIGRHLGWYRVVVELDKSYKHSTSKSAGSVKITLK